MKPWTNLAVKEVSSFATVPAPTGGLNRRDSFAAMAPTDAVLMRNWIPTPTAVEVREGWQTHVANMGGPVQTVATFTQKTGVQALLAFANGTMQNVTAAGTPGTVMVSGLSNNWWQHVNPVTTASAFIYMVNGQDAPIVWDGTTINRPVKLAVAAAFSAGFSSGFPSGFAFDVTGVDPKTFINVCLHQRRLWFVTKDSTDAWYLPVDQLGGTAVLFPVGQLFPHGGYLMSIASWTLDAGAGLDDYLAFISSEGDLAIYVGSDPDSAETWQLQGVYYVGSPIGRRCFSQLAGDVTLICEDGLMPLAKYMQSARIDSNIALSTKIQKLLSELTRLYTGNLGWQVQLYPRKNLLYLNVPGDVASAQYVMNLLNGSWTEFIGMDALCWTLFNDQPVFGTRDARVCRASEGYLDDVNYSLLPAEIGKGHPIETECLQAFSYFGQPGQPKRWTMARPIFQAGGIPSEAIGINVDFNIYDDLLPPIGTVQRRQAIWDFDKWDQSIWSAEITRYQKWQSVEGVGFCAGLRMKMAQTFTTSWIATDFKLENGHGL